MTARRVFPRIAGAALLLAVTAGSACDRESKTLTPEVTVAMEDPALNQTPADCGDHLFTDKQRLAVLTPTKYAGGVLCAVPDTSIGKLTPNRYQSDTILVAWVITAAGDAGYASEGFGPGRTCIYVGRKSATGPISKPEHLVAFVQTMPPADTVCPAFKAGAKAMKLFPGGTAGPPGQIPPVVRIDQDIDRHILIGLPCLPTHWCEITWLGTSTIPAKSGNYRREIKGWYDEQPLALMTNTGLVPSAMVATMYPSDELEAATTSKKGFNDWTNVAVIKFKPWPTNDTTWRVYAKKWGFSAATAITAADSVYMQLKYVTPYVDSVYEARYVINGTIGKVRSVTYVSDSSANHKPANSLTANRQSAFIMRIKVAAVRWGWDPKDESGWTRCTAGCCEIGTEDRKIVSTTTTSQ